MNAIASFPLPAENDLWEGIPVASLAELRRGSSLLELPAGHLFFRPGEPGRGLFLLEAGHVETFRIASGKRLLITELGPGAVFGEMGCVGRRVYHCFAEATAASRVRLVPEAHVERLLHEFPFITRRLLDLVSERFVKVLLDLESTSFRNLIPRVSSLLLERAVDDCVTGLTHKELAERLHVHRESVTAALSELRSAGIIAVRRKQIVIVDRLRLERARHER